MNHLKNEWLAITKCSYITKSPKRFIVCGVCLVLYRTNNGEIVALEDICPHRHAQLSKGKVVDGCLQCPYHGWKFNAEGKCHQIPGLSEQNICHHISVNKYACIEKYGMIWVCLSQENVKLPNMLDHIDMTQHDIYRWHFKLEGDWLDSIENFLDATHTHFVHDGLIRSSKTRRQKVDVTIEIDQKFVSAHYINETRASGLIPKLFEGKRAYSKGAFRYPNVMTIEYGNSKGANLQIYATISPESEYRHYIATWFVIKKGIVPSYIKYAAGFGFFKFALKQDIKIIKQQLANKPYANQKQVSTRLDFLRPHIERICSHSSVKVARKTKVEKVFL